MELPNAILTNKYLFMAFVTLIFITFHTFTSYRHCLYNCVLDPKVDGVTWDHNQPIADQRTRSLSWNNKSEKLSVENIEYNINVSESLRNSIEGDLWHPLKGYKSRCWVEKIPEYPTLKKAPSQRLRLKEKGDKYARHLAYRQILYKRFQSGRAWKMRCLPFVYILGVTKSGTSDFYKYLTQHQQIAEPFTKEIHYWNARRFPRPVRLHSHQTKRRMTFDQYLQFFDVAAHEINTSAIFCQNGSVWHPKITVDASIATLWEDNGWTQIPGNRGRKAPLYTTAITLGHYQPEAKFIVLLREPVERVYSYYRMMASSGSKSSPEEFHNRTLEVLDQYKECLSVYNIRECAYSGEIEKVSRTVNIRSSLYSTFFSDWLKIYPMKQFHVIRSEDYYANRRQVLEDSVKFLGLDPYLPEIASDLASARIIFKNVHYTPMLNSTRRMLQKFFDPFNKELDKMFGRKFWSYDAQPR